MTDQTTDITTLLRADYPPGPARHVILKAADEIERLRKIEKAARALVQSRDALRRNLHD